MIKYFENDIVKIHYVPEIQKGIGFWDGKGLHENYKEGSNQTLNLLKEKNLSRRIGDMSKLGVISQENQKWTNENWFPRVISEGLKRIAVVVSSDIFGKMSVDSIMSKVSDGVFNRFFDNVEDAKQWVVSPHAIAA